MSNHPNATANATAAKFGLTKGDVVFVRGNAHRFTGVTHGNLHFDAISVAQTTTISPENVGDLHIQIDGAWTTLAAAVAA